MTTITIDDDTKEDLLKVAAQLKIKRNEKINYNTTIKYLLANYQKKRDEIKFRRACEKVENIDINEVVEELYLERKRDEPTL